MARQPNRRAQHLPLSAFAKQELNLPKDRSIASFAAAAIAVSIAASLLQARGYKNLATSPAA